MTEEGTEPLLYSSQLETLFEYINTIKNILKSQSGYTPRSKREEHAYKHLEKMRETSISLLKLVPGNGHYEPPEFPIVWDISSLAAITRCLMDIYLHYHYYIEMVKNEDEFALKNQANHYLTESRRLDLLLLLTPESKFIPGQKETVAKARAGLEATALFQKMTEKEKNKILTSKTSMYESEELSAISAGIEINYYRATQKYLSMHSHFFGFAFSQFLVFDSRDKMSQMLVLMSLDYANLFLAFFLRDFKNIYPGSEYIWSPKVKENVLLWINFMYHEKKKREKPR